MKIIDKFIMGKISESLCEDAIYVTENYIALADGATSLIKDKYDGKYLGKVICDIIGRVLENSRGNEDLDTILRNINLVINNFYLDHEIAELNTIKLEYKASASMAIYLKSESKVYVLGDISVLINGKLYEFKNSMESTIETERAKYIESLVKAGVKEETLLENDISREYIKPLIIGNLKNRNPSTKTEGKLYVIDGTPLNVYDLESFDVKDGDEIIFASDGYVGKLENLDLAEKKLKEITDKDPLMYKDVKKTKGKLYGFNSFDDRSYIKFKI